MWHLRSIGLDEARPLIGAAGTVTAVMGNWASWAAVSAEMNTRGSHANIHVITIQFKQD